MRAILFSKYILAFSSALALSACVKDASAPEKPIEPRLVVSSVSVLSYDTQNALLTVKGRLNFSVPSDLATIDFYSDATCSGTSLGKGSSTVFSSSGVLVTVSSITPTNIYATSQGIQTCSFVATYTPDHSAPPAPDFTFSDPGSPSRESFTPIIHGTVTGTTSLVKLYSNASCTTLLGSGPGNTFSSLGILVNLLPDTTTSIYAIAAEAFGNESACTKLTDYQHSTFGPSPPLFSKTIPSSPTNSSTLPKIIGTVPAQTNLVFIYSDAGCSRLLNSGTAADFTGDGIQVEVEAESSTRLYGKLLDTTGAPSACRYLTTYIHETTPPAAPSFISANPTSPTRLTIYPKIKGLASSDTATVKFFNDSLCVTQIGSGSKSLFEGVGITASASQNMTIPIYAESFDLAGNASECTLLTTYKNNTIPPDPPVYNSTNPVSPNNVSTTPYVLGNATETTETVKLYKNETCTQLIGEGLGSIFSYPGIQVTVPANQVVTIYGTSTDFEGNVSECTPLTNYAYSNLPAPVPAFSFASPPTPTKLTHKPRIIGTTMPTIALVSIYKNSSCTDLLGSGTRITFVSAGIQVTLEPNSSTDLYATATDVYGNNSPCTFLTNYIHDNTVPPSAVFTATVPASPNNQSFTPQVQGSIPVNPLKVLPVNVVSIYDNFLCLNRVGVGDPSEFSTTGIMASVGNDRVTSLYARTSDAAGNLSACTFLLDYTHDSLKPGNPKFKAALPASPSYNRKTKISGTFMSSTDFLPVVSVGIYEDDQCSLQLGTGSPEEFQGTGIQITSNRNTTTSIYAKSFNLVGNESACMAMLDFVHNDTPPANLQANQNSNGSIGLIWSPDTLAYPSPQYIVKRSLKSGGPYSVLKWANSGPYFTDIAVANNKTYYYVVASINNTGISLDSDEVSITATPNSPDTPATLVATGGYNSINLTWSGSINNMTYSVYRGTQRGGPYSILTSRINATTYNDTLVSNDVPYYYIVVATNPLGKVYQYGEAAAVARGIPNAPTDLTLTGTNNTLCGSNSGPVLNWTAPAYYEAFNIYRGNSNATLSLYNTTTNTTFSDCNPQTPSGNDNLFYAVTAVLGTSESGFSNQVTAMNKNMTKPTLVPDVNEIQLYWTAGSGEVDYQILRATKMGGPYTVLQSNWAGTSYDDTGLTNGQGYFYVIIANYSAAQSGWPSDEVSAVPAALPSAPAVGNLRLTVNTSNKPDLTWSAPSHYTGFNIYRSSTLAGTYSFLASSATNTYSDPTPLTGMNYYKVSAAWGLHETSMTNAVPFRNGYPATITATASSSNIAVSWGAVSGANGYKLYRSTTSGSFSSTVYTGASTSYTDSTAVAGQGYFYMVQATFADTTVGQNSAEVSGMRTGTNVPSGLTVLSTTANSVTLKWAKVNSAGSYKIYQATASGGPYTLAGTSASTSSTVTVSLAGQTYYFKVSSVVSTESAQSAYVSATTNSAPIAPGAVPGNNQVLVTWNPTTGATSHTVQRTTDVAGGVWTTLSTNNPSFSFTDSTAVNGNIYFYRLIGNFSSGTINSAASPGVTPGITPLVPAGLTITGNSSGTDVWLSWSPVIGATGYNIYVSTTSGSFSAPATLSASSNSGNNITGLTTGVPYYIAVTSLNGSIESTYSSQIAVIPTTPMPAPTAITTSSTSADVTWTAVGGAIKYDVQRSTDGITFSTIATNIAGTSYTDNSLDPTLVHFYRYQSYGTGSIPMALSDISSPGINGSTQPLKPENLWGMTTGGSTSVDLGWVQSPNVIQYNIYRGTASGGPYTKIGFIADPTTTYTDTTGSLLQTYYYVVRSMNTSGVESPNSNEISISLSSAPASLTAGLVSNKINLSWSAVGGVASYTISRSMTATGPFGVIASGITGTSYIDANLEGGKTYYYVVNGYYAAGYYTPASNIASATASLLVNLEVPIELADMGISAGATETIFERTRTSLDPSFYDGTVTYFIEAVATNSGTSSDNIDIVDGLGNTVGSLAVPANTNSPTRLRNAFTPNPGSDEYRVKLQPSSAASSITIYSIRLIVKQVAATKTRLYVPMLASSSPPQSGDSSSAVVSTSAQSYSSLQAASIYTRNTANLRDLAQSGAWELEVIAAASNGATGEVALYDRSTGAAVPTTETLFLNSALSLTHIPFEEGESGFGTNEENHDYEVALICYDNCTGNQVSIYKAGLWITLVDLAKAEIIYRTSLGGEFNVGTTALDSVRTLFTAANFSNPVIYFQAVGASGQSGSSTVDLMSSSNLDSGTGSLSAVTNSTVTLYGNTKSLGRSIAPLTLTTGHRYIPQFTAGGMSINRLTDTSLVIQVSN